MGEMYTKPSDFRPARGPLSAEDLNKLLRAIPRVITGDSDTVKRYGDRIVIENDQDTLIPDNDLQTFVVIDEQEDTIRCVSYDVLIALPYDALLPDSLSGEVYYIAKPYWLQQSPFSTTMTLYGANNTFSFIGIGQRFAIPQTGQTRLETVYPAYAPGSIITARSGQTGYYCDNVDGGVVPVIWTDINESSRIWRTSSDGFHIYITSDQINNVWEATYALRDNITTSWTMIGNCYVTGKVVNGKDYPGSLIGFEPAGSYYVAIVSGSLPSLTDGWVKTSSLVATTWSAGTYPLGSIVNHNGSKWINTVITAFEPKPNSPSWVEIILRSRGNYDSTALFVVGDYVRLVLPMFQATSQITFLNGQSGSSVMLESLDNSISITIPETDKINLTAASIGGPKICATFFDPCKNKDRYFDIPASWEQFIPCSPCDGSGSGSGEAMWYCLDDSFVGSGSGLACDLSGNSVHGKQEWTQTSTDLFFVTPAGVISVLIECWGLGGLGTASIFDPMSGTFDSNGDGGGGGAYAAYCAHSWELGAGTIEPGAFKWSPPSGLGYPGGYLCVAASTSNVNPGLASASVGTVRYNGGTGGTGNATAGGGGASSAGPNGPGTDGHNAIGSTPGAGAVGGFETGTGGHGATAAGRPTDGEIYGGGGGGGGTDVSNRGGKGAGWLVRVTW